MTATNWESLTADEFWLAADGLQNRTLAHAENLFALTEEADPDALRALLIQYRYFTIYYIPDLALLIARLKDGALRSFLADILADELGNSDPLKAHPRLYDDFLASIGVSSQDLDSLALKDNIELLDGVRAQLIDPSRSSTYGLGLRGMGGECVCQIYITQLHKHMMRNPYIQKNRAKIDWRFWDLHVGEHDIEHRTKVRQLINDEILVQGTDARADLGRGYDESMNSWRMFWNNIFASLNAAGVERIGVEREAKLQPATPAEAMAAEERITQFHYALPVRDLEEARLFYRDVLGAKEGRSTPNFIDFNFYGHHIVLHIAPSDNAHVFDTFRSDFHGEKVPVPHFGMNLDRKAWTELAERIMSRKYDFFDPPHIRLDGKPGEHATMFLLDPSGNALEFKTFRNHHEVFSKVFDPKTKDLFGLEELVATPARDEPSPSTSAVH